MKIKDLPNFPKKKVDKVPTGETGVFYANAKYQGYNQALEVAGNIEVPALSVEEIEKQIDLEYYLSVYNDGDYVNDLKEYEDRRKRLAQAIHNLIINKSRESI